jgi:TolB-like protein/tetratricopeptide (TPR) repeat protein
MNETPRKVGLWEELKRRHVVRVATVYAVVSWLVIQVADTTFENFGIPDWAFRFIVIVLLLGFPISVILAWALELTPEGIRLAPDADKSADDASSTPGHTARRKRFSAVFAAAIPTVIFGTLALVFYLQHDDHPAPGAGALPAGQTIAVLPLVNMSMMAENTFFAGGLHEDILTNLSRMEGFQVVSRTSVMPYLESNKSLRQIGEELGADLILEGSVRRIDNHVRVTVQLIEAANDRHLWANNYDREVRDEFATQGAVAREISRSVQREVLPDSADAVDGIPTTSVKAYDLYNQALNISRTEIESEDTLTRQRALLEEAVAEDPEFVEAWGLLNEVLDHSIRTLNQHGWFLPEGTDRTAVFDALRAASKRALDKAVSLDPDNVMTLLALASDSVEEARDEFNVQRRKVIDQIVEEHPDEAMGWYVLGWWYFLHEEHEAAREPFNKAITLDPFHAQIVDGTLNFARITSDQELVTILYERVAQISPERGEQAGLSMATHRIRLYNLESAFLATADPLLVETMREILFNDDTGFLTAMDELYFKGSYFILSGQPEALLALEERLEMPGEPDAWDVMFYNNVSLDLAALYLQRSQPESARSFARQVLATQRMPQASHPETIDRNHANFATACAILDDLACSRRWAEQLINGRDDSYNQFGLAGFIALSFTDLDQAVQLILSEKQQYPRWRGTDVLAAFGVVFQPIVLHPDLAAFYRSEGKWTDYLAERIPEYAAIQPAEAASGS